MRILTSPMLPDLIDFDAAQIAVENAYRSHGQTTHVLSVPSIMLLRTPDTTFRYKAAWLPDEKVAGIKLSSSHGRGFMAIFDARDALPLALIAEDWLYPFRTALTAATVARRLAPPDVRKIAVIGAGKIGRQLVATLSRTFPNATISICARREASAKLLADQMAKEIDALILVAPTPRDAIQGADIVVTMTTATEPFIESGWLSPGALFLSMGGTHESHFSVLQDIDRFIVDDIHYALVHGDLSAWVRRNEISTDALLARIDASVGEVFLDQKPGRQTPTQRILAVVQGMANCDLALAWHAYSKACERNIGTVMDI